MCALLFPSNPGFQKKSPPSPHSTELEVPRVTQAVLVGIVTGFFLSPFNVFLPFPISHISNLPTATTYTHYQTSHQILSLPIDVCVLAFYFIFCVPSTYFHMTNRPLRLETSFLLQTIVTTKATGYYIFWCVIRINLITNWSRRIGFSFPDGKILCIYIYLSVGKGNSSSAGRSM